MRAKTTAVRSKSRSYQLAIVALIASNIIWGAAPPIFKFALYNIPPFSLAFLRFAIAAVFLLPFLHQSSFWRIEKKDWPLLLQNAFYGVSVNISFFFLGLKLAPSINAAVIATASSIFTTLLATVFIKERPSSKVIIGNLIGFAGVFVIVVSPFVNVPIKFSLPAILGNLLFVGATLAAAAQVVTSRKLALKYPARTFTFYSFAVGSLTFLPLSVWEFLNNPLWPISLDIHGLTGIVFGAILSSLVGYTFFGFAAETLPAAEVGLYAYINPVVTVLIAVPLLGEAITAPFIIGTFLALGGIYIAERRIAYLPYHRRRGSWPPLTAASDGRL